jgi:hypothetical protein
MVQAMQVEMETGKQRTLSQVRETQDEKEGKGMRRE